ncbi:MAG: glycosyltransferase family 4 protein [Bacteroidia bacterium]|nr:glycosyltransferase family 4 protein [Bacteroidia bacterium]
MKEAHSLYAAFDLYPSAKGAATHIYHMARTLFSYSGAGILHCLGHEELPIYQEEETFRIHRFVSKIPNYLQRAEAYSGHLGSLLEDYPNIEFCHFRDIWSGIPILSHPKKLKSLFEVNGLPSIELPYRYPNISRRTLDKIHQLEMKCLEGSDFILTPSHTTSTYIQSLGIQEEKIKVIPNGADVPSFSDEFPSLPSPYIIYFGALQSWQGISTLLKAFRGLEDYPELKLLICSSSRKRFIKSYRKLAEKLEISDKILWKYQLPKEELYHYIKEALFSVAPLKETARNVIQGCSPLKILESMACGTAVLASDLAAVREIIENNVDGKLVRPDRPAVLSRAMRYLLDNDKSRKELAKKGHQKVLEGYLWQKQEAELIKLYKKIM